MSQARKKKVRKCSKTFSFYKHVLLTHFFFIIVPFFFQSFKKKYKKLTDDNKKSQTKLFKKYVLQWRYLTYQNIINIIVVNY